LAFKKLATPLLQRIGRATSLDLTSLLIPASWVSTVEGTVDEAIATAYDVVILRAMRSALRLEAEQMVSGDLRSGRSAAAVADTLTLEAMPSYQAWSEYTRALSNLEQAASQYNGLTVQPNINHFGHLAQYLFGVQIQTSLDRVPDVYREALGNVRADSVRLSGYRDPATARMRRYARRFNEALPQRYGVLVRLRQLSRRIDRLSTVSVGTNLSIREEEQELRSVRSAITQVEAVLKNPGSRWLTADTLALERVYGSFLAFSDTSSLMADGLSTRLRSEGNAAIDQLHQQLSNVQSNMTGPLLKQEEGRIKRAWTSDVASLRDALGKLLDQPFMRPIPGDQTLRATIPPGRKLRWNGQALRQIVQHIQVYDSVTTKGLSSFPPRMRQTARQVAAAGISNHMQQHLGRAQSYALSVSSGAVSRQEAQLQRRSDRFREALAPLNTVLTIQGELNMDASQRKLARVVAQEAFAILEEVNTLLVAENLYGVGASAFEQWQGRRSPNLVVVNARDSQEVSRYLELQREQMSFLAQDVAGPALSFLANWEDRLQVADRPLVSKWQEIRSALRRYQNKSAGNALAVFENFLTSEMSGVKPVSYFLQTPASRVSEQSSNYFLQKRNLLRRKLFERSRELARRQARQGYRRLASAFNQQLSGRFPFAALADSGAVRDAAPIDVRQFYEQFDSYADTYRPVLQRTGMGEQGQAFLRRLEKLRPFFGAYLDNPSTYPIPTVDVAPIFRVNREREVWGDQVIRWRMRVAGERATYGRSDTLHWAAGDRVAVRLRWASDAPTRPVSARRGTVSSSARTVTYRYGGQWALLRLLRRHAAPPRMFERRVDPDPHTLQFRAQVEETSESSRARVFIRQHLYRPDETVRIILSTAFPKQAPALSDSSKTLSRRSQ
jgi:type VI secretion system protein ImpL